MYISFVFGGCFDTNIKFRIFISHFIRCQFRTFAVSHFAFYTFLSLCCTSGPAICHKSWWGSRPLLSLFQSSFPSSQGVWADPAHPLPNILMHLIQSNSIIKSTLMFSVLPGTEISVHAEFSDCRQN